MKANPLLIVAIVFAASFSGRAVGLANATLNASKADKMARLSDSASALEHSAEKEGHKESPDEIEKTSDHTEDEQPSPDHGQDHEENHEKTARPVKNEPSVVGNMQQRKLLKSIRERDAMLDAREEALEDRIRALEITEVRIDEKLSELKTANSELSDLVTYANDASQQDISRLAKMYEQMKPQKAGELFNQMDATFAAGFLTQMSSESAALILTNMGTDKAYAASMTIASRNAAAHQN